MAEQKILASVYEGLQTLDIHAGFILNELKKTLSAADTYTEKLNYINDYFRIEINANLERLRIYDIDIPIAMGRL